MREFLEEFRQPREMLGGHSRCRLSSPTLFSALVNQSLQFKVFQGSGNLVHERVVCLNANCSATVSVVWISSEEMQLGISVTSVVKKYAGREF